jgi:hypothetical protein
MKELNAAQQILLMLGAHHAPAQLVDVDAQAKAKARAKRRTRPMTGRGNYGKNLRRYFDMQPLEKREREQAKLAA